MERVIYNGGLCDRIEEAELVDKFLNIRLT